MKRDYHHKYYNKGEYMLSIYYGEQNSNLTNVTPPIPEDVQKYFE